MSDKIINYFYNLAGMALLWLIITWLQPHFYIVQLYSQAPVMAQFFMAFVFTMFAFIGIIALKIWILKDGKITTGEKVAWYAFASPFTLLDGLLNINYASLIFLQPANAHGEGWLFTSRINWHVQQVTKYGKPLHWRFHLAHWFCQRLHAVDQYHCRATK